jgi:plastocyanin
LRFGSKGYHHGNNFKDTTEEPGQALSGHQKETPVAGIVLSALVLIAIGSIGYYQLNVAPNVFTSSSTTISTSGGLVPGQYVNVTIPSGASSPPSGYAAGAKTQYGYEADTITVVIGKNNTVNWINNDVAPHTATSDVAGLFDTGTLGPGASKAITLTTTGTFTYHCSFHPWMQGTVIVKSG